MLIIVTKQAVWKNIKWSKRLGNAQICFILNISMMNTYLFVFIPALARSESKRDGGFKSNWSFDHEEESEGDTDKE